MKKKMISTNFTCVITSSYNLILRKKIFELFLKIPIPEFFFFD